MTPGELRLTMPVGPSQNDLPALLRALADRLEEDGTARSVGALRLETELGPEGARPILYATVVESDTPSTPMRRPTWYGIRSAVSCASQSIREERVLLFKVSSFTEAIMLAQEETEAYVKEHPGFYSLGDYEAFRIDAQPGHGVEVFSQTVSRR